MYLAYIANPYLGAIVVAKDHKKIMIAPSGPTALLVILWVAFGAIPSSNANIYAMCESADPALKLLVRLWGIDPLDFTVAIEVHDFRQRLLLVFGQLVPGGRGVLHEGSVALAGVRFADLFDDEVSTASNYVADVICCMLEFRSGHTR